MTTLMESECKYLSPVDFAMKEIEEFKRKSDHNKSEALTCFFLIVVSSLASPLFVTLGEGTFWGKIVPSVLSLSTAASTAWLQLRKPQNLWPLYRDSQRRIEDHLQKYKYKLDQYAEVGAQRDILLADAVRSITWDAHQRWLPLVPTSDSFTGKSETRDGSSG